MYTTHALPSSRRSAPLAACSGMRGISLIEVLVGLMLFSFGILGLVGLQASMTEAQTDSKFRADAAYLADELVGIMWSQVGINASDLSGLASYTTAGCGSIPQCADWQAKNADGGRETQRRNAKRKRASSPAGASVRMRVASPCANSRYAWSLSSVSACSGVLERLRRVQLVVDSGASNTSRAGYGADRHKWVYIPRR